MASINGYEHRWSSTQKFHLRGLVRDLITEALTIKTIYERVRHPEDLIVITRLKRATYRLMRAEIAIIYDYMTEAVEDIQAALKLLEKDFEVELYPQPTLKRKQQPQTKQLAAAPTPALDFDVY